MSRTPTPILHMMLDLGPRGLGTMCQLRGPALINASITHCRVGVTCLECLNALDKAEKGEQE